MDISTIGGFLLFLGTPAFVNWIITNVLDKWDKFQKLDTMVQNGIELAIAAVLALLSWALVHFVSPDFWAQIQPFYSILFSVFVNWVNGQIEHGVFAWGERRAARICFEVALIETNIKRVAADKEPIAANYGPRVLNG